MLEGRLLLDGAMGTALIARGLPAGALPEEWLLSAPDEIAAVHEAHAAAGARVLLTCTFNVAAPRLAARVDPARIPELCARAAGLALPPSPPRSPGDGADTASPSPPRSGGEGRGEGAAASPVLVAGAVGPTGLAPPLGPGASPAALRDRYLRPLEALAAAGVDLLWIESQHDLVEARAALSAARSTGLPAAVTFGWPAPNGRYATPGGAPALDWLRAAEGDGAAAVGVNCVFPGPALDALVADAAAALRIPVIAKPSPGLPGSVLPPDAFAAALRPVIEAGARLVGGCCGAGQEHLKALGAALAAWSLEPEAWLSPHALGYDPSRNSLWTRARTPASAAAASGSVRCRSKSMKKT